MLLEMVESPFADLSSFLFFFKKKLWLICYIYYIFMIRFSFIIAGDVLVVLDMRQDESLFEAGVAREVIWV